MANSLLLPALAFVLALPSAANPVEEARRRALSHFIAHQEGQPTVDTVVRVPDTPDAQELRLVVEAAKEVQLGCALPCDAPDAVAVYRGKVQLVAAQLRSNADEYARAIMLYAPHGRPHRKRRPGTPPPGQADRIIEGTVLETLLRGKLDSDMRASLGRRAQAYANALGGLTELRGDTALAGGPLGPARRLTLEQLAELNAAVVQANSLRRLARAPSPPPPLTAAQRQRLALEEGERLIAENPGTVRRARNFWIDESRDANNNWLWRGYSYLNRGLLALSGLTEVEESAARTGWASAHSDISAGQSAWQGVKLAGNSVMFALNFVGIAGAGQVVNRARNITNPAVIEGLERVGTQTARRMAERADEIQDVVGTALSMSDRSSDYVAATNAMDSWVAQNLGGAFRVQRGGKFGEANFVVRDGVRTILWNPAVGKSHEFTHAVQMLVNRSNALEVVAARYGRTVQNLTASQIDEAMALAARFEKGYYAAHEAQALRSAGFMGLFPGNATTFTGRLAANSDELVRAWTGAPQWNFTTGQRIFGSLSGLGESQLAIGGTLMSAGNVPRLRQQGAALVDYGETLVTGERPSAPRIPTR